MVALIITYISILNKTKYLLILSQPIIKGFLLYQIIYIFLNLYLIKIKIISFN